ncbi:hypothetical protein Btru_030186 [Bulinus truncatus]|nr:hypothetical protein Btru_030186 [Bulinus truncatus]
MCSVFIVCVCGMGIAACYNKVPECPECAKLTLFECQQRKPIRFSDPGITWSTKLDQQSSCEEDLCESNGEFPGPVGVGHLHMFPGDVFYYSANSSVLCLHRDELVKFLGKLLFYAVAPGRQERGALQYSASFLTLSKVLNHTVVEALIFTVKHEVDEDISITPASPRLLNLNPTAQPFRQTPSGATLPKNLNPSAPVFQQSGDRSPSDGSYLGQEAGSPGIGNGDSGDNQPGQPNGALLGGGGLPGQTVGGGEEDAEEGGEADSGISEGIRYPASVLEPIKKQMQFYFSAENLPNDKFLNSKMDNDKYIPLDIFLDFNRIKPICSNFEQLAQAVESSSILELNDNRTKVRVSQCRKTLTLRGFPASATEDDIRQFILDMGASPPTHIEFVMVKDKCSTWYVSFRDESIALNCFFRLHNTKAEYRGYPIGCCIKSSGTLAAAGYFPSSEESSQRRMAHQNHVSVSTVNHTATTAVQNTLPQPQQPQTLMQSYNPVPIYNQIMPATTGSYYHVTTPYMPYMTSMIAPGWPGPTAMEPGIIMQSNGLQPQHIRTNMARPQIVPHSGGNQRFNKPQRNNRQQPLERSASERSSDRGSVVSVSTGGQSRSSPRNVDASTNASIVQQGGGGGYVQRRSRDDVAQVINPQQMVAPAQHQFVTPLVSQQPQQHVVNAAAPAAIINPTPPEGALHFQPAQPQQQPIIVQPAITVPTTVLPLPTQQTNNPPPLTPQQQMHQNQPPPPIQIPHHHQQPPQPPHHHQQPAHHQQQHSVNHQPPPPPPPQSHHQPHHQQPLQGGNHQPHPHSMMPPPHHPQSHHQMLPPPSSHQQHTLGNRRRKNRREDNVRNQRNQPNRVNFSSQAPAAADNFTMEANSFPPLPGAANSVTSSEVSHENRMSDIVRGKPPRTSVSSSSGAQRAPSTTPSPVTTPAPATVASTLHQRSTPSVVDTPSGTEDVDSVEDEDSQEEVDTDESRSIRSETHSIASSEPSSAPVQSRSQKASTPVATSVAASTPRQVDSRQSYNQVSGQNRTTQQPAQQPQQQQQTLMSPVQSAGTSLCQEAPKPSYAQMVAQKNREAANGVTSSDIANSGSLNSNPNSGSVNGPTNVAQGNNNTATSNIIRSTNQSSNAFREQGNYQASGQQPGPRSTQRGSSKDNLARTEGPPPSSRPPSNGSRRNSKENRTSNKFERRKPDTRPNLIPIHLLKREKLGWWECLMIDAFLSGAKNVLNYKNGDGSEHCKHNCTFMSPWSFKQIIMSKDVL